MHDSSGAPTPSRDGRSVIEDPATGLPAFRLIVLCLLLLVCGGLMLTYVLSERDREGARRSENLWNALEDSRSLFAAAADMEAAHRGFLLTGDTVQLEGFQQAAAEFPTLLGQLQERLGEFPALQRQLARVEEPLQAMQSRMGASLMLHETHGHAAALRASSGDLGKPQLDALRTNIEALERAIVARLADERAALAQVAADRSLSAYVNLLLVAAISVFAALLGERHFRALQAQRRLQQEVQRRQRESRDKSNFLAQASHEIRTPMNAIFGFSGLLHDRLRDPVDRRYIESIMSSARALLSLINDLLDLSKIEAGRIELNARPMRPREVIDGVIALFSQQAAAKNLQLRAEIDAGVPAALLLDSDRTRQMLVNLVGNAVKYTDAGEIRLHVAAEPCGEGRWRCRFEVCDTGVGIAPDELEAIFTPFVQGRSREHRGAGTGLGLAITRELARLMGGEVSASSEVGHGSTFRITLESVQAVDEPAPARADGGRLRDLPPARILIVDDVAMNRELLEAMFRDSPHEVVSVGSGAEAMEVLRRFTPDVVLLDLRMDDMDGVEVARRLRADPATAGVRILVVTASNIASDAEMRLFDSLILKPFTEQALLRELAALFRDGARASATASPGAAAARAATAPEVLDESLAELERLLADSWPTIKDTLTMSEVRQFAGRIEALTEHGAMAPLQRYARKLREAAASFDVAHVEALLTEFPERMAQLRGSMAVAAHA